MKGSWIETYTGKKFYPLDPRAEDVDIFDIAHHLSNLCRYTGATSQFYSVAQHSLELSYHSERQGEPKKQQLAYLLHDAHEAYVNDMSLPMKENFKILGLLEAWNKVVANIDAVIFQKYGINDVVLADYDHRILLDEKKRFFRYSPNEWELDCKPLGINIEVYEPKLTRQLFVSRFEELIG